MKAFVTLIPTRRNDGSPVTKAEQDEILGNLVERFGGLTVEGTVRGEWIDPESGKLFRDESLKVLVAFERIEDARDAVRAIGKRLDQLAMYFEVREGIEFLDTRD
jgi:hypothetical protein